MCCFFIFPYFKLFNTLYLHNSENNITFVVGKTGKAYPEAVGNRMLSNVNNMLNLKIYLCISIFIITFAQVKRKSNN